MKRIVLFLAAFSALLLAGCNTLNHRIEQHAAMFNALDAPTQAKLRAGTVEIGYTTDMVYVALGAPDESRDNVTAKGRTTDWIYNSYSQDYVGTANVGYRRYVSYNKKTGQAVVWIEPVYRDVYRDRIEPRIRISFKNGRVSAIEQVKR
ncbi:hypothetical protein K0B96_01460 [Horticoccus luteus]|uniref:Lipoprotein n=1 Tax=Horticoccus luteus TaxID=2862869 RepID=A0A8F9XLS1_9BACT|nr:hypothetical protein [Horticoccus luteus]QYM79314.1 hypothetical protein K0B96_01460 [Horticoccus luteus]